VHKDSNLGPAELRSASTLNYDIDIYCGRHRPLFFTPVYDFLSLLVLLTNKSALLLKWTVPT
jgi:hypothetical protein